MGNLKWVAVALGVLVALYLAMLAQQSGYTTPSDAVFPEKTDDVAKIEMWTATDTLALRKEGDTWKMPGVDTLQVRQARIEQLFSQVLKVKKETLVSRNRDKWTKFSVDDSSGTHVKLSNAAGQTVAEAVFGRSMSDWSHNYVRTGSDESVYLTNQSVMHMLYPRPTYWGEKPLPVKADTVAAAPTESLKAESAADTSKGKAADGGP